MIMDALRVPRPVPEDEGAYLALFRYRSLAVAEACRRALAAPGEDGSAFAARYLRDAVSALPVTYPHAPAAGTPDVLRGLGRDRVPA
jgi:hypothetical protein